MSRLNEKVALIIGGSRGIGAAIAKRLAANGASVAITYAKEASAASAVVRAIELSGGKAVAIQADAADVEAVKGAVEKTVATYGQLDVLVNNAGTAIPKTFETTTLEEMDRQLARILSSLQAKVGDNYLLAVTADHGMPPEPSSPHRRHFAPAIVDMLHDKFDPKVRQLITSFDPENSQIFVDEDRLPNLGVTLSDVAHFLESQPYMFAVFTIDDVRNCHTTFKSAEVTRTASPISIEGNSHRI
jgi:NAD(P)-dependent dehydrogenase (short-subunit alcohol dehydrogenase family)